MVSFLGPFPVLQHWLTDSLVSNGSARQAGGRTPHSRTHRARARVAAEERCVSINVGESSVDDAVTFHVQRISRRRARRRWNFAKESRVRRHTTTMMMRQAVRGCSYGQRLGWVDLDPPSSAWASGNMAELAKETSTKLMTGRITLHSSDGRV